MQFSTLTFTIALVALFGTAIAYPASENQRRELGCVASPATTRTPYCSPQ